MHGDQDERRQTHGEAEHLLSVDSMEMGEMSPQQTTENKTPPHAEGIYTDEQNSGEASSLRFRAAGEEEVVPINGGLTEYRVYKVRWFGLSQLILLNIVVSWDVSISHLRCASHTRVLDG